MNKRTRFEAAIDKRRNVTAAEKAGQVADSKEVRLEIMARVHRGEITLAQAQTELTRIQRDAKANGKLTRAEAFRQG